MLSSPRPCLQREFRRVYPIKMSDKPSSLHTVHAELFRGGALCAEATSYTVLYGRRYVFATRVRMRHAARRVQR